MANRIIIRANGCWTSNCTANSTYNCLSDKGLDVDIRFTNENNFNDAEDISNYDYLVLEGCSVNMSMEIETLEFIEKVKGLNPKINVLLCGCGANNKKSVYQKTKLIDGLFDSYSNLIENFKNIQSTQSKTKRKKTNHVLVKNGCNRFCSYCIVPYVRSPGFSVPMEKIIDEIKLLKESGFDEIRLTGLGITGWNNDGKNFSDLLEKILNEVDVKVYVYEFHPLDIDDRLIELLSHKNMTGRVSIPLQSGSDKLLKLMNRGYTTDIVKTAYRKLLDKIPKLKIKTELMFGFPYETEDDINQTIELFKQEPFNQLAKVQVYPFSPRPFTKASKFPQVQPDIVKKRIDRFCDSNSNLNLLRCDSPELDTKSREHYLHLINKNEK